MLIDTTRLKQDVDLVATIEQYLGPGQQKGQWHLWLCPFHQEKTPSFKVKAGETRFKCYGCGEHGDVIDFIGKMEGKGFRETAQQLRPGYLLQVTDPQKALEMQRAIRAESERKRQEAETARRQEAADKLAALSSKVEWYHAQVEQARAYWHSQGLRDDTIEKYRLGYCPRCPTYPDSDSYVIPYFQSWQPGTRYEAPQLISIRHRLASPNGSGKYRPEFAGLPNQLFNTDALDFDSEVPFSNLEPGQVILVEGEVKAIYLSHVAGMPAVGVPGASAWQDEWLGMFAHTSLVYVVFDPGAEEQARSVTGAFNGNGVSAVQVTTTSKPDDMFVKYGCSIKDFLTILRQGRRVQ